MNKLILILLSTTLLINYAGIVAITPETIAKIDLESKSRNKPYSITAYSTATQDLVIPGTFSNIDFNLNENIAGWTHAAAKSSEFIPNTNGLYQVTLAGKINNMSARENQMNFNIKINNITNPAGNYSITLAPNEIREFAHTYQIALKAPDIVRFQMSGTSTDLRLSPKTATELKSNLPTGQSIRVTIRLMEAPSLRDLSVSATAKKIKNGAITLDEAKQLLPPDLHEELEAALK